MKGGYVKADGVETGLVYFGRDRQGNNLLLDIYHNPIIIHIVYVVPPHISLVIGQRPTYDGK